MLRIHQTCALNLKAMAQSALGRFGEAEKTLQQTRRIGESQPLHLPKQPRLLSSSSSSSSMTSMSSSLSSSVTISSSSSMKHLNDNHDGNRPGTLTINANYNKGLIPATFPLLVSSPEKRPLLRERQNKSLRTPDAGSRSTRKSSHKKTPLDTGGGFVSPQSRRNQPPPPPAPPANQQLVLELLHSGCKPTNPSDLPFVEPGMTPQAPKLSQLRKRLFSPGADTPRTENKQKEVISYRTLPDNEQDFDHFSSSDESQDGDGNGNGEGRKAKGRTIKSDAKDDKDMDAKEKARKTVESGLQWLGNIFQSLGWGRNNLKLNDSAGLVSDEFIYSAFSHVKMRKQIHYEDEVSDNSYPITVSAGSANSSATKCGDESDGDENCLSFQMPTNRLQPLLVLFLLFFLALFLVSIIFML